MLSRTAAVFAAAGIVLASPLAAAAAPMTDPVDLGGAGLLSRNENPAVGLADRVLHRLLLLGNA